MGSNIDLPINVLVQLDNVNIGGEVSYAWSILDQPAGTVDALSSPSIQNPTFTPKKEGTYLLKLIVNANSATESQNLVIAAVLLLKTRQRLPAAGETLEYSTARGWAVSMNGSLAFLDRLKADPGVLVGVASGAPLSRGTICRIDGTAAIKVGLPGMEVVPAFAAVGVPSNRLQELLVIVEEAITGASTIPTGALGYFRVFGRFSTVGGTPAAGTPLWVSNASLLDTIPGAFKRLVGCVAVTWGSYYDAWFDGGLANFYPEFYDVLVDGWLKVAGLLTAQANIELACTGADASILLTSSPALNALVLGTMVNAPLYLRANSVNAWAVWMDGTLRAVGGNRQIQNVADPTANQHAATKRYVDLSASAAYPSAMNEVSGVDATTNSLVWVDLLSFTFTAIAADWLLIWASISASLSNGTATAQFRLMVNGVGLRCAEVRSTATNNAEGCALCTRVAALLGANTIKLQWQVSAAIGQIRLLTAPSSEHATIVVKETSL